VGPRGAGFLVSARARAADAIRAQVTRLVELSHRIHATPEVAFEEVESSRMVADELTHHGFAVVRGACNLPTAFLARRGDGALHIGLCAEYDSLPAIGHACGHNIISAASVGAAIGLAAVASAIDATIHVVGTPAEEIGDGGGKILLQERGAFDALHATMMVHPGPVDVIAPRLCAASTFDVHYTGRAAHAFGFPELGINAADALTIAQTSLGLLRQHLGPDDRVHGIVTHGGDAPNIVPAFTTARYTIRAMALEDLEALRHRVYRCFEAGALATGTTLRVEGGTRPYAEVVHDAELAALYGRHAESLGRRFATAGPFVDRAAASTDMGNVSRVVPSIHPLIGIDSHPAVNHQPEFAAHCVRPAADKAVVDGAIALAWTAIDAASDVGIRARLLKKAGAGIT
jgi:amidohydrolase